MKNVIIKIKVYTSEDINNTLKTYDYKKIQFIETCSKCGKEIIFKQIHLSRIERYKLFLCRTCYGRFINLNRSPEKENERLRKIAKTKRNWTNEQKEDNSKKLINAWKTRNIAHMIAATKNTKLINHGDPNYNNIKQGVITNKNNHEGVHCLALPKNRAKAEETFKKNHNGMTFSEYHASEEGKAHNKTIVAARTKEERDKIMKKMNDTFKKNHNDMTQSEYRSSEKYQNKLKIKSNIKYGTDYPQQNQEIKNKIIDFLLNRSFEEKQKSNELRKQTYLEKTGFDHQMHNPKIVNRVKKIWKNKPENELINFAKQMRNIQLSKTPEEKQKTVKKRKAFKLKKYGDENYINKEKAIETNLKRYNYRFYVGSDLWKNNMIKKYGSIIIHKKYIFYGVLFDSSWELAVWIYHVDNNIPIIRSPINIKFEGPNGPDDIHDYVPDFMINGKLIEIKGKQFWKSNGTMHFPYTKLHHNSNLLTPEEKAYWDDLYERKHQCGLQHGVEFWKEEDCKLYIDYCNLMYPGWKEIFKYNNPLNPSYWCFNISNPGYYQPQYYVPIQDKGATPYNKPDKDGYILKGKGISPYDIIKPK